MRRPCNGAGAPSFGGSMQTIRMVSTSVHSYAGHRLQVGQEFDCELKLVEWMQKMGRARPKVDGPEEQTYQTRDMTAETPRRTRSRRK
jgi:hypothetical protein